MELPDVAGQKIENEFKHLYSPLNWVGMSGIEVPVLLTQIGGQNGSQDSEKFRTSAKVDAFVNLKDPHSRGIHMSRLFKETQDILTTEVLSASVLTELVDGFLDSHSGLSDQAQVRVRFEAPILRKALKSENFGWRTYPVILSAKSNPKTGTIDNFVQTLVEYSSTCPASAALARDLIQTAFRSEFTGEVLHAGQVQSWLGTAKGVVATPHSQRSQAVVKVKVSNGKSYDYRTLILDIEKALKTPVQSIVKREDEQEFALLNGQNLMFCEDAARRIKAELVENEAIGDFFISVQHLESLHPHDATAVVYSSEDIRLD